MTTILAPPAPTASPRATASLGALARREAVRFARSPVFLLVIAVLAVVIVATLFDPTLDDVSGGTGTLANIVGGFTMVAAFWQTQSTLRGGEVLDVAPTAPPLRTAAVCFVALVSVGCGLLAMVTILVLSDPTPAWAYGVFGRTDQILILASQLVATSLGGPLLGIAVGRWVRATWLGPVLFVVAYGWVSLTSVLAITYRDSVAVSLLRTLSPFTFFTDADTGAHAVYTWRGSPGLFLGWQLCLCAVAVIVALLREATPPLRRRLLRTLAVVLVAAAAMFLLSALGGHTHALFTSPAGTREV